MHLQELKIPQPEFHSRLNPEIWITDQKLAPGIPEALMKISRDFQTFVDIPFPIVDIQITGAQANYNYTADSDLDLHIVTDFEQIDCDEELEELFDTKRHLYNLQHHIEILGIPVELYVEDIKQPTVSAAYSILKNTWIRTPKHPRQHLDPQQFSREYRVWLSLITHAIPLQNPQALDQILKLLKHYRTLGLRTPAAEFSTANQVYKSLRRAGVLDLARKVKLDKHDQMLSVK